MLISKFKKTVFPLVGYAVFTTSVHAAIDYTDAGNVSVSWQIEKLYDVSSEDPRLTNLTFRFNVNNDTLHDKGTYFAQQFHFDNVDSGNDVGYLGLQPRKDKDGKEYLRAVFSSFLSGTQTQDKNCSEGADGGDGVSCGIEFPAIYGHPYAITVHKTAENTWSGEVQDQISKKSVHIGSWTLPDSVGDLLPSGEGFAEYYAFYKPGYPSFVVPECSQLAKINVFYGPVTTTDFGGGIGSISNAHEYNTQECLGDASDYSSQPETVNITMPNGQTWGAQGQHIVRGFVSTINH